MLIGETMYVTQDNDLRNRFNGFILPVDTANMVLLTPKSLSTFVTFFVEYSSFVFYAFLKKKFARVL